MLGLRLALTSAPVLEVREAESGARLFCVAVASGDEVLYLSINSIYNVPVQERWRVQDDGALAVVEVISTPAVIGYYSIEDFTFLGDGLAHAVPRELHLRDVRLKVGARGQQRLVVGNREVALYQLVPEASVVIVAVREVARLLSC